MPSVPGTNSGEKVSENAIVGVWKVTNQLNNKLADDFMCIKNWALNRIVIAEVLILLYLVKYIIVAIIGLLYRSYEVHSDNLRVVKVVNRELTKSSACTKEGLAAMAKIIQLIKQSLIAIIISHV